LAGIGKCSSPAFPDANRSLLLRHRLEAVVAYEP